MIQPQELRIGNYYQGASRGNIEIVTWQTLRDLSEGKLNLLPIPLTEEIFLKFGFENIGSTYTIDNDRFEFSFMFYDAWNLYYKEKKGFGCDEINLTGFWNIHQLQNLYFALTGEELTF